MSGQDVLYAKALTEAWLGNPNTRAVADDVPAFFLAAHAAVEGLQGPLKITEAQKEEQEVHTPAVSVRASLADPNRIVSVIDGKPYSFLTRHLKAKGLTPDQYRQRYDLEPGYPMIAPGYSKARSEISKRLGLGGGRGKKKEAAPAPPPTPEPTKKSRARLGIVAAKAAAKKHLGGS